MLIHFIDAFSHAHQIKEHFTMKIGDIDIVPSKIICLGRNYLDHAKEMNAPVPNEPLFFAKTPNCLIKNGDPIIYPKMLDEEPRFNRVDHEVELAVVIGKRTKNVRESEALESVLGYTIFLDITARAMQKADRDQKFPWFRSKSFDTFGPIGPRIVKDIEDPHDLELKLSVNGKLKQSSNTKHLIFNIPYLISYISSHMTLETGDIIATGTPSGVGPILPGDTLKASIESIGSLHHPIILEE